MSKCDFCGWEGADVQNYVCDEDDKSTTAVCMSCQIAISVFQEASTVGKMHPARLVPLLRTVVAQSVGSILANIIEQVAKQKNSEDFNALVDIIRNSVSNTDPN